MKENAETVVDRAEVLDESGWDFATKKLQQGERLINAGKVRRGLKALHDAVYNVRASTPAYETALERIRNATELAARADNGRHASYAQEIARIANQQEAGVRQVLVLRPDAADAEQASVPTSDTPVWCVMLGVLGLVSVALAPGFEFIMGIGFDGGLSEAQLLFLFAFVAVLPLGLGLALLAPALSRSPGWRVGLGLLLGTWVAVTGAVIGAEYTSLFNKPVWDVALTVGAVGGLPFLAGLTLVASGLRGRVHWLPA